MTVFFRNYLINLEVLMINNFSSSIWNLILNYYLKNNLSLRHNICWFSRWRCNVTTPHIAGHMLIHSMEHFRYANCSTNYTNVSLTPNRNTIYSHIRTKWLEYDRLLYAISSEVGKCATALLAQVQRFSGVPTFTYQNI